MDDELSELAEQIKDAERHLSELRKEYRERKTQDFVQLLRHVTKLIRYCAVRALGYRGSHLSHGVTLERKTI